MKEYLIHWELHSEGISKVKANSLKEAREKAEDVGDFGDTEEFQETLDWQDHLWEIASIEEIK